MAAWANRIASPKRVEEVSDLPAVAAGVDLPELVVQIGGNPVKFCLKRSRITGASVIKGKVGSGYRKVVENSAAASLGRGDTGHSGSAKRVKNDVASACEVLDEWRDGFRR